jgi:tripartite-type tricarboxylate transporter receptor subunit TctC
MKTSILAAAAALSIMLAGPVRADWAPEGPITLLIGLAAGGGADTQARLIAEEIEARTGWRIIPEQAPGRGGLVLANRLRGEPADGTVIGMLPSEALGYSMVVAGAGMTLADFTPLATSAAFDMGVVALSTQGWSDIGAVFEAMRGGQEIRFGVMSDKLADFATIVGEENGVAFNIVTVDGGAAVMNGLMAGDLDIGLVAGAQARAVAAGDMVNLASTLSRPLNMSPEAPMLSDFGVPFTMDGYFMFAAPAGLPPEAREAIAGAIAAVVTDPASRSYELVTRGFGGPAVLTGDELDAFLARQWAESEAMVQRLAD